ncbi:TetR/AcrR family transcriptional regulator [Paracoccus sp. MBLB3053]|uniref:TetR/AcrR family transcriptional regulator n=1 Tax=Paracoccus aurantius TaxID=3073814 RepID=A0ABU2HZ56_9RHOB|nr:TetR/AcrR family transcriptional regulator [Paracoccus sp. MBLB3053]MDS9469835.1 TetR/AcrR family transcriptional regulator [Paracoccus sp. MBLB3053]
MKKSALAQTTTNLVVTAAEKLFSERGFAAVSMREIAREAGVVVSSVIYHYPDKIALLAAIYDRHTRPINARRRELLGEARRIPAREDRLRAELRAYLLPAFSSSEDATSGGASFTRLRAILSAEGDPQVREVIAGAFDETTREFIAAFAECLPGASQEDIVWRAHFLLGSLYYTLINPDRIDRLSDGRASGRDHETAIRMIVETAHAGLMALSPTRERPEKVT